MFIIESDGAAKACECRNIRIAEEKLKASGISEEFRKMRFENFDFSKNKEVMNAFKVSRDYCFRFDDLKATRNNSIMLLGQVGSGKTHLAMSVSNILLDTRVGVIYMPYRSSITNLKQSITDELNYKKEINKYKDAQVLFIDDLFKGRYTESDINIIYEIIDYRYFKCLPVIVTSEKTVAEIIDIDEAIGSRLYEMSKNHVISMRGKHLNYRMN